MSLALRTVLIAAAAGAIAGADPTPRLSVDRLPARLDRAVAWRAGTAGIEYGELQLSGSGEAWRTRVVVARLDPRRVPLALETAFTEDALWTVGDAESSAALAVNAGQFRDRLPWGWVVTGGRQLISPGYGPLAGAVVVDRSGSVRIVSPDSVAAEQRRGVAREAFQSYPMLLENGAPPEALVRPGLGVAVDHRDARLALGCVLYEMLSGEPPFKGPNPQATLMRRFMGPPRPLRPMVPIPEHVEAAIMRAVAKEPGERYATADELADALAGREPARPAPAAPAPATTAPAKRGCAAVLVAGIGLAGAGAWLVRLL